jgi:hypothetical protein
MKRPYEVQFVHTHESTRWVILEDAWSLRTDFRWKWMSRLAGWLIRKIGVNARDQVVDVQRLLIDPPAIVQKLFEQRRAMFDMGHEPKRLLIGSEDFAELMRQPEMRHHFTIDAEYMKGDGRGGRRVMDLTIEVVPWMRGCLVMP